MGQRVSGQASTILGCQEILHLKLNPKLQQHIHKNTQLEPFLSQLRQITFSHPFYLLSVPTDTI
jgi:hypothetical protein